MHLDTPFVTYIYIYIYTHTLLHVSTQTCYSQGHITAKVYKQYTIYVPYVKCLYSCHCNTKHKLKLHRVDRWRSTMRVLGKFSSEPILFEFNITGVYPPSKGKVSEGNSMVVNSGTCVPLTALPSELWRTSK